MSKSLESIRETLRARGVHDEALVTAMMDSFESLRQEVASVQKGSPQQGVPGWVWSILGAVVIGNLILSVSLYSGIKEIRLAAAALPKIEEVAADVRKLNGLEPRFITMLENSTKSSETAVAAAKRLEAASDGLGRSAIDIAENSDELKKLIQVARDSLNAKPEGSAGR